MLEQARKGYEAVLALCGDLAGVVIASMALLTSTDVVLRSAGGAVPWILDVVEYALFAATFVAAPWVLRRNAHVSLDAMLNALPDALRPAVRLVGDTLGVLVCVVFVYFGTLVTFQAASAHTVMLKFLVFPEWWILWIIPASMGLLGIEFTLRMVRSIVEILASHRTP